MYVYMYIYIYICCIYVHRKKLVIYLDRYAGIIAEIVLIKYYS